MKLYIQLLKSNLILKQLSLILLLSYFGAWFSYVAIYTLLIEMNVDASIIAFVAMLHFLAGVIQAPFSGTVIDRVTPKKLMLVLIFIEIVSTFLLIYVSDIGDLKFMYILIFVKMAAASFYFTAEMSLLPKLLSGNDLQMANELHSIIWSFSYTLGMSLSGYIVYIFGVRVAFLLDTLMFVIAFWLLYRVDIIVKLKAVEDSFIYMMKDTLKYFKTNTKAMHLIFLHAFVGLTAFDTLVALMVENYYVSIIATSLALGLLNSARAVGLVIGPLVLSKWMNNKRLFYIFIAQAISIWVWAYFMDNFYLSLLASVFVGFFSTTLWSYTYTLLQKNIQEKYYGRIVAYNDMMFLSTAAIVSFLIGYLYSNKYSLEIITFLLGMGFVIGAIYYQVIVLKQNIKEI
jgi:MFS family permease